MKLKLIVFLTLFFSFYVEARTFKIGVLAPEGTNWAKHMSKMGKEIKKATKGKVRLKFFFGGGQGDEGDVLRKVRINQLQGGVFTGKTLGDISGDIRVVEIPFIFGGDRKKAWDSVVQLTPYFTEQLKKNEFINLGLFEIGMVYFVSQKKTPDLTSLKGIKIWSWEGDQIVSTMIKSMELISVPLPLPDVLGALSTGIIQAAYAPPMGMIALQWNNKIKYMVDFPIAFSVGAFLISDSAWKKISPEHQKIVMDISKEYMAKVNESNKKDNIESMAAMKTMGIEFIKFPKREEDKAKQVKAKIVKDLTGKLFSAAALSKLEAILK